MYPCNETTRLHAVFFIISKSITDVPNAILSVFAALYVFEFNFVHCPIYKYRRRHAWSNFFDP
jgi:hypothetical protein